VGSTPTPATIYTVKIYTRFDENRPGVIRLWVRSWSARGWTPRLLIGDEVAPGLEIPCDWINFSSRNPRSTPKARDIAWEFFREPGWQIQPVVSFPGATEEEILACGRSLNL